MVSVAEPKRLIATVPPLSCSRALYSRLAHQHIIQRDDSRRDKYRVRAGEDTVHQAGSGNLGDRHVSRYQRENGGGAAGEKYQLDVETVLGKDAGLFGDPRRQLIGAGSAVADIEAGRLSARRRELNAR